MTSPTASVALQKQQSGALAELSQETLALTRRLFLQLMRRPSTLIAGVLQPLIWLILFGALFANACLLYTSPSPRDRQKSRMPSSA